MTKSEIRAVIDADNGEGFSSNINLNGYVFTKRDSFLIFELKTIEDVRVCHIKYIHFVNEKDAMTILTYCCNFWMGNHVQFLFYREKDRDGGCRKYLKDLGFREYMHDSYRWKWRFHCKSCHDTKCHCTVYSMYK